MSDLSETLGPLLAAGAIAALVFFAWKPTLDVANGPAVEPKDKIERCVASGDCLGASGAAGSGRSIDLSLMDQQSIPCLKSACVSGENDGTRVEVRVSRSGLVLARVDTAGTAAAKPRTEWRAWTPQIAANGSAIQWSQKDGAPSPGENRAPTVSKGTNSGNGSAS